MAKFFETEEDKLKAIRLVAAISQMGSVLDEICFTPLRDIQVFFKKVFGSMSGPSEPIITALLLAGSFTAAIPYLAKIFNENETTTLQDLLANSDKECGTAYLGKDKKLDPGQEGKLRESFQANLNKNNMGYLTVDIARKDKRRFKNFFRKEEVCDIKYKFKGDLSEILHADEELLGLVTHQTLNDLNIIYFDAEQKAFMAKVRNLDAGSRKLIENMIPEKGTLAQGRKAATERVKAFKLSDAPLGAYEATNGVSFQYWLAFFVFDMMYSQDDATKWNLTAQFTALGAAVAIFTIKVVAQVRDWWKRRKKEQQTDTDIKDNKDIQYANKSLKQKQLTSFFNEKLKTANEERLKNSDYRIKPNVVVDIDAIIAAPLPEKSLYKRIRNWLTSTVKKIDEYEEIIQQETAVKPNKVNGEYQPLQGEGEEKPKQNYRATATRVLNSINITAGMGIGFSFIEWVLTVGIAAIYLAKTGAQTVSNFLDGLGGGLLGLGSFVLGTLLGIVYYNKKVKPGLDKAREALDKKFKDPVNAGKIARLKVLEQENTAMRKEWKKLGIILLPTMKIYDDRAYRRITTEKTKGFTLFKKIVNRFSVFIGKAGTGILLFRFLPLAICGLAGISLATAVASVFWPITVAAIVIGLAWGIMYTYKYIQERRIESAKRFLDRLDVTLETAETHNAELREQCRPIQEPAALQRAAVVVEENISDDTASTPSPEPVTNTANSNLILVELKTGDTNKFSTKGKWSPEIFAQKHCREEITERIADEAKISVAAPAA